MDPEYARKKALMDWIVDGMAGRHYPKPVVESDIGKAAEPEVIDDRPLLIKAIGKFPLPKKLNERLNVVPWEKQKGYWDESVFRTRQDIIKDYMVNTGATFEEAMKWAKRYDDAHKTTPVTNTLEKAAIKKIFERDGIKRLN
jgi:hypothetical protein